MLRKTTGKCHIHELPRALPRALTTLTALALHWHCTGTALVSAQGSKRLKSRALPCALARALRPSNCVVPLDRFDLDLFAMIASDEDEVEENRNRQCLDVCDNTLNACGPGTVIASSEWKSFGLRKDISWHSHSLQHHSLP